jgi:hypothetical protein
MAFFLLIPDGRRLLHFFVLNRSVAPTALGKPFESAWLNRIALVFKLLFLCATFYWTAMSADEVALRRGSAAPKPPLYGLYEVESFSRNGEEIPFVSTARRWRRAVFNRRGVFAVQWMDDTVRRFGVTDDAEKGTLTLTSRATSETSLLHYTKPNPDEIAMEGDFLGEPINARLRKLPEPEFLLGNRGFHWINERPFNR